jgi:hypothetical protein
MRNHWPIHDGIFFYHEFITEKNSWFASRVEFWMTVSLDQEDKLYKELSSLQGKVHNLSTKEIEQNLVQLSGDTEFLEEQIKVDTKNYATEELAKAFEKISYIKEMKKLLSDELSKRPLKK